jgi:parallel beta-helix repeat protein
LSYLVETSPASGVYHGDTFITNDIRRSGWGYISSNPSLDPDIISVSSSVSPEVSATAEVGYVTTWEADISPVSLVLGKSTGFKVPAGSVLFIKPGVTVESGNFNQLRIEEGTLIASGEAGNPIRFTSAYPAKASGDWNDIFFNNVGTGSIVRDSIIEYADKGLFADDGSSPLFERCSISSSEYGIYVRNNSHPIIRRNEIYNNNTSGIAVERSSTTSGPVIYGNTIYSNGGDGILCMGAFQQGTVPDIQANWIADNADAGIMVEYPNPRIHHNNFVNNNDAAISNSSGKVIDASDNYYLNNDAGDHIISLEASGSIFTFEAASSISGVHLKRDKNYSLDAGSLGPLSIIYISAEGSTDSLSMRNYTEVIVTSESEPDGISVLLFEDGASSGDYHGTVRIVSEDQAFRDNYDEIRAYPGETVHVTLADNPGVSDSLAVSGVTTFEASNNPHRFESNYKSGISFARNYTIPSGSTLMIQPGVTVECGLGSRIFMQGELLATGEADNRITFTSANPTLKSPGDWYGIYFGGSGANSSMIRYSDIRYGVYGVYINNSSPRIFVNNIEENFYSGIYLNSDVNPKIADNNILNNGYSGIQSYSNVSPLTLKVNYNNIYNGDWAYGYGVERYPSPTRTYNFENNYWGSENGPYHPTSNPSGNQFSEVTSYVDFTPYSIATIEPGGPVASDPTPEVGGATNDVSVPILVRVFDPEDVGPSTIRLRVTTSESSTYDETDAHFTFNPSTNTLTFDLSAIPTIELPERWVTIEVIAAQDSLGVSLSSPFTWEVAIDLTSPEVADASFASDPVMAGVVGVTVTFSDYFDRMDNAVSPEVWLTHALGGSLEVAQTFYSGFTWEGEVTIPDVVGQGLATLEVYGASDRAGNILLPSVEAGDVFIDTVTAIVTLESPNGGEIIASESTYVVSWESAFDQEPSGGLQPNPITLYYSENDGIDYKLIETGLPNVGTFEWTVPPMINSTNCRIKIAAEDLAGNIYEDASDSVFTIEAGYPFVLTTSPTSNASNVLFDSDVTITFSEAVITTSAISSFSMNPVVPGAFSFTDGDRTMVFDPVGSFEVDTLYTVYISTDVVDSKGNPLPSQYQFSFSTGVLSYDVEGPTISHVSFNGVGYISGDVVGPTPLIEADIVDNVGGEGVTYEGITISFGSYIISDIDSYDGTHVSHRVSSPLGAGLHAVSIEAQDRVGNNAVPFSGTVRVGSGQAQVFGPVMTYPTPFKPLSGGNATIAYMLTDDARVTIYLYDISGRVVYTGKFGPGSNGGRAGYNAVEWNGISDLGGVVGNGIYVFKITSGKKEIGSGKMVVYE